MPPFFLGRHENRGSESEGPTLRGYPHLLVFCLGQLLELPLLNIGLAPQDDLEQHGLQPGLVHLVHLLGAVPLLGKEGLESGRDGVNKGGQVAITHVIDGVHPIRAILARPGMAQPDLVLVIEPGLVVVGPSCIENPLSKTFADGRQVVSIRLASRLVAEKIDQERMRGDEAIPDIEDGLHLVLQDIVGQTQGLAIFVAEQDRLLEPFEVFQAQRRARNGTGAIGIV